MKKLTPHRISLAIFAGLLIFSSLIAKADFITDRIMVEVRTERFGQGSVIKKLPSGTSVEVLMTDGQYSRIRTPDNITGWINSTFLTKKKPTQLEYLELLAKSKSTEAKLKAAEEKLAAGPSSDSGGSDSTDSADNEEIETLKKQAQDARWMKVEMMKARDRADQAEAKLKAKNKNSADSTKALETLRTKNKDLEQRLAAALLVNKQQEEESQKAISVEDMVNAPPLSVTTDTDTTPQDDNWTVGMKWFFGSLFTALLIGFIAGITWLDKRSRQRHGGFRIY